MCANFTDDSVLCEKCVEIVETQRKVEAEAARHEKPDEPTLIETPDEEVPAGPARKESNPVVWQIGIIGLCGVIVIARATIFAPQTQPPADAPSQALELSLMGLAQCLVTFQQIGSSLAAGETPDPGLVCSDSPQPNRVLETADDIIIEHPNPTYYGYARLFVSRSNPVPVLEPLEEEP